MNLIDVQQYAIFGFCNTVIRETVVCCFVFRVAIVMDFLIYGSGVVVAVIAW